MSISKISIKIRLEAHLKSLNKKTFFNLKLLKKLANGLPLEPWLQNNLPNITKANQLILNLQYGSTESAKLVSGEQTFFKA